MPIWFQELIKQQYKNYKNNIKEYKKYESFVFNKIEILQTEQTVS